MAAQSIALEIAASSGLDAEMKSSFSDALRALPVEKLSDEDNADVLESSKQLKAELEKPAPEPRRVKRYWKRIKDLAPTAAKVLSTAKTLKYLLP